ncbi:MAG: ATP-binding cassette domain-containing protein [Ruminococcus sp.]|jgi:ABC-type multidrug transport system fused ATPase/permease subunit|nr:ATP-binding cassette domain-containing protein [Ruminococcus sp.]
MKKTIWLITALIFIILLWIIGYGLPATIAAALLLILFKATVTPIEGFAKELTIRQRLMKNDVDDIRAGINTIHSLGRVAYEFHRITSASHNYEQMMKLYLTIRQIQKTFIKVISALAIFAVGVMAFAKFDEKPTYAFFGVIGTTAVLIAIVMGFRQADNIEEEFISADVKNSDFVIDALPENPLGAAIEIEAVYSFYGSKEVINGITLKIKAGERFGIIGRTNSGKTTLLNLITRKISPVSGEIYIDGGILRYMTEELVNEIFTNRVAIFDNIEPHGDFTGKTVIIASQKTADVMDCNRIAVIDNGMIEAIGTHEALLSNNLLYRELFTAENPDALIPPFGGEFSEILEKLE